MKNTNVMQSSSSTTMAIPATFDGLLNGAPFLNIKGQLLYKKGEEYVITNIQPDVDYTLKDYMELPENAPYQLINCKLVYMPSPFDIHQKILSNLHFEIKLHLRENNLGVVRFAPLDVHFDQNNVYQPDLLFVSIKRSSIIQKWIMGAPDFVVEILSVGTAKVDREEKKAVYGKYNVLEYWLIDPNKQEVAVYHNKDSEMELQQTANSGDRITSIAITGLEIEVKQLFE